MPKYIALHTLKKSADEVMKAMDRIATEYGPNFAKGKTPAVCIKIWDPISYGSSDYMFSLWEAEKPEDIHTALAPLHDYLTVDCLRVDAIDRKEPAASLEAAQQLPKSRKKGRNSSAYWNDGGEK